MSDTSVRSTVMAAGASISIMALAWAEPALAQDEFCTFEDMSPALRQTVLVIDSAVIQSEPKGAEMSLANDGWRDFLRQYVDARSPDIASRLDPRERVTVMVANADGAGATQVFSGCIPVFSPEEEAQMRSEDTALGIFIGKSWKTRHEDMAKSVARQAQRGMSEMTRTPGATATEETDFATSGLIRSLRRAQSPDLVNGVPRLLVYTDLSKYAFPEGSLPGLRNAGFADAKSSGLSLGRAEMHLVSIAEPHSPGAEHYLRAFFLGSEALLASQSAARGRMQPSYPVADVAVFSGAINYGDLGDFPVRMRLVRDVNGTTTNSWFEEVGKEATFVPVEGQLSCDGADCQFTQTQNFAQMWASDPNAETPECGDQIAFLGMRMLDFETDGDTLTGKIHDTVCYLPGFEDGIPFDLKAVENGRW